ncbi:MAG: glycosyl transferase family protein [Halothiobacillaceae bacterium]|nr:MAG: glycosyl transferase family protein [Halothiobacillaceae bacterium]
MAYKHVLSLIIAQRRPSGYLGGDHQTLEQLTDSHLRLLAAEGVISNELKEAALVVQLKYRTDTYQDESGDFATKKAANAVRTRLAALMGIERLYDLDRIDLSVKTTLNGEVQHKVTEVLRRLKDPAYARAAGLYGDRLLGAADPGKVIYSLTLQEVTPDGVKPRIQADNFDQPFDINQGTKLDLGSTAKLRTLVTYLEIIEKLYLQYATLSPRALRKVDVDTGDELSRWVINYLIQNPGASLKSIVDASLDRSYSASPREAFYTGGGVQYFKNFKREDDGKVLTLREATRHSVNLVFIRLMRDIRRYYMFQVPGASANILKNIDDPRRGEFLKRFADREGQEFMTRFYNKYRNKSVQEIREIFFSGLRPIRGRLAAAFRYIYPTASYEEFVEFMASRLPEVEKLGSKKLHALYAMYGPDKFSLADQGYVARVHPLELWLVRYLITHPGSRFKEAIAESGEERIAVYNWLIKTSRKNAQDIRIRNLLEVEAFLEIHRSWKRLGYPFDSLVPSLATAIGSSADRPAALVELMGIIVNNGVKFPTILIEEMHFAKGTPFETIVKKQPIEGERMFSTEVAMAMRGVLMDVVEKGTAARLAHAIIRDDGVQIPIGGKTGTGDHRYITFAGAGVVKSSRAVNRSATFVFFIGDRFFGTLTAFVPGSSAAQYRFTSALSVQTLKYLLPTLKPIINTAELPPELLVPMDVDDVVEEGAATSDTDSGLTTTAPTDGEFTEESVAPAVVKQSEKAEPTSGRDAERAKSAVPSDTMSKPPVAEEELTEEEKPQDEMPVE